MKKEDLIKLGLDDEMAQKVADASAEELKGFIPKQRFDDVNTAKKQLEKDIADRDAQLEELKKIDAAGLQQKIEELQQINIQTKADFEAQLSRQTYDYALDRALLDAKAKNLKAVKALLDTEIIKLDGENLLGLTDQLTALKESDAYLFNDESEPQSPKPSTFIPGSRQKGNNPKPANEYEAARERARALLK